MTLPIRGILKLTGNLLRQGWLPLVLVTLVYLLPIWVQRYGKVLFIRPGWRDFFFSGDGPGIGIWVFLAISAFSRGFHMCAVTEIALRTAAAKPTRPGRLILRAATLALPILVLHTLLELIILVGSVLLVVPGLFLGAALSVVVPAYICEGKSFPEAFRRSFKLTEGRRLPIGALWFSIIFVVGLLTGSLLSMAIAVENLVHYYLPTISLPPPPTPSPWSPFFTSPLGALVLIIASGAYTVALMVLNVSIYLSLRFHKADQADNQIAAVFE